MKFGGKYHNLPSAEFAQKMVKIKEKYEMQWFRSLQNLF